MNPPARHFSLCAVLLLAGLFRLASQAHAQGGVPLWTNRYHGPGNGDNHARAVVVSSNGNVFVTGDSAGSGGAWDYATVAYSSAGAPLWTNRYHGPGNGSYAVAVALGSNGNVFVTGDSAGSGGASDYATVAYSSAGQPLWTNRYDGPGNHDDRAYAIAADNSGNVFVTGYSLGGSTFSSSDYATVAYSIAGIPLWTNRYGGPGDNEDWARAVAADSSGNVLVTGYSFGGSTLSSSDYATIKYSGAGVALWTNRYDGPGNGADNAVALATDSSGNVFVTGTSLGGFYDYATVAYSSTGMPMWTNRYHGPGTGENHASAIAVDRNGNVIVTGDSPDGYDSTTLHYATVAYSNQGIALWTNRYHGPGISRDYATAIAVDRSGNVFVTGGSESPSGDYATVAYSSGGVPLWTNRYNGPANDDDSATALAVDDHGNIIVTGSSWNGTGYDYVTIKYSSSVPPVQLSIAPDGSGGYFIRFSGIPGSAYRLQRATNLVGPWTTSAAQTAPDSGMVEFHDLFPLAGEAFYRTVQR